MSAAIEQKAVRYVAENRVRLTLVHGDRVRAEVRGSALYTVELDGGGTWRCSCPAWIEKCCHVRAVELVVIPKAAAAPEAPEVHVWEGLLALEPGGVCLPMAQELGRVRIVVERLPAVDE